MSSVKNVIQKHNSKIMENPKTTNNKTWSCRQKSDGPLNQNCLYEYIYNKKLQQNLRKEFQREM